MTISKKEIERAMAEVKVTEVGVENYDNDLEEEELEEELENDCHVILYTSCGREYSVVGDNFFPCHNGETLLFSGTATECYAYIEKEKEDDRKREEKE